MSHELSDQARWTHGKYPPPKLLDAPPELIKLVEDHVNARGSKATVETNYAIRRWLTSKGARSGCVYVTEDHLVCCLHGGVSVSGKARLLSDKTRSVLHA